MWKTGQIIKVSVKYLLGDYFSTQSALLKFCCQKIYHFVPYVYNVAMSQILRSSVIIIHQNSLFDFSSTSVLTVLLASA